MRYDGPPGTMLDLVEASANRVDLEWDHPYSGARPYRNSQSRESSHPYLYAENNPANRIDPSGLHSMSDLCLTKLLQFAQWYQKEKARGSAWTTNLPACPCSLLTTTLIRYRWFLLWEWGHEEVESFVSPDCNFWTEPELAWQTFHPGAYACIRTRAANANGSGQQCCYDDKGQLITHGPGAGTPDRTQSGGGGHVLDDVFAYNMANFLDTYCTRFRHFVARYLDVRPPNNADNCPTNP